MTEEELLDILDRMFNPHKYDNEQTDGSTKEDSANVQQ